MTHDKLAGYSERYPWLSVFHHATLKEDPDTIDVSEKPNYLRILSLR